MAYLLRSCNHSRSTEGMFSHLFWLHAECHLDVKLQIALVWLYKLGFQKHKNRLKWMYIYCNQAFTRALRVADTKMVMKQDKVQKKRTDL